MAWLILGLTACGVLLMFIGQWTKSKKPKLTATKVRNAVPIETAMAVAEDIAKKYNQEERLLVDYISAMYDYKGYPLTEFEFCLCQDMMELRSAMFGFDNYFGNLRAEIDTQKEAYLNLVKAVSELDRIVKGNGIAVAAQRPQLDPRINNLQQEQVLRSFREMNMPQQANDFQETNSFQDDRFVDVG